MGRLCTCCFFWWIPLSARCGTSKPLGSPTNRTRHTASIMTRSVSVSVSASVTASVSVSVSASVSAAVPALCSLPLHWQRSSLHPPFQVAIREALFLLRDHVREGTLQPLMNRMRRFWRTTAVFFHCPNAVHFTKSSYRYCAASRGRDPPFQSRVLSPEELADEEAYKRKQWLAKTGQSNNVSKAGV